MMHEIPTNRAAWQGDTYPAWVNRYGAPHEAVSELRKNPTKILDPIRGYLGPVAGKKIANLLGSCGIKAIALAMLGADVTLIDYSPGNVRYARELARAAYLDLDVVEADILELDTSAYAGAYDIVFAEMGIVHYFTSLPPFFTKAASLLKVNGRFVLRDFHPISTKLVRSRGTTAKIRKHKVDGDYFDTQLEERPVAYGKHLECTTAASTLPVVRWRKWTLGEIVTGVADSGLFLQRLVEEPHATGLDKGIPKTFTLVAGHHLRNAE
jgi:SAM-dependent methyltransferase